MECDPSAVHDRETAGCSDPLFLRVFKIKASGPALERIDQCPPPTGPDPILNSGRGGLTEINLGDQECWGNGIQS